MFQLEAKVGKFNRIHLRVGVLVGNRPKVSPKPTVDDSINHILVVLVYTPPRCHVVRVSILITFSYGDFVALWYFLGNRIPTVTLSAPWESHHQPTTESHTTNVNIRIRGVRGVQFPLVCMPDFVVGSRCWCCWGKWWKILNWVAFLGLKTGNGSEECCDWVKCMLLYIKLGGYCCLCLWLGDKLGTSCEKMVS